MSIENINHYDFSSIDDDIQSIRHLFSEISIKIEKAAKKSLYLFSIFLKTHKTYSLQNKTYLEFILDKKFIEINLSLFFCFIYNHYHTTLLGKYHVCMCFKNYILQIYKNRKILKIEINTNKISNDIKSRMEVYNDLEIDLDLLKFYKGWKIKTADNKILSINLANIYINYGKNFCSHYHSILKRITSNLIKSTTTRLISNIYTLNRLFCTNFSNINELLYKLNNENAHKTFNYFYNILLIENLEKNQSLISFHDRWASLVRNYNMLVEYNFFDPPLTAILVPKFKNTKKSTHHKINTGKIVNDKLIFNIPLHYTDNTAKELIFQRLQYDEKFIIDICSDLAEKIKKKYEEYYSNCRKGINIFNHEETSIISNNIYDICATYNNLYKNSSTDNHLPQIFKKIYHKDLKEILPNITQIDLYPLIVLLIKEHPQITESWLTEWKLYKNGELYGYTQEDDNFYITSIKKRKRQKAIQKILLNHQSKKIVDDIIFITSLNREKLKASNNEKYEYMLLENISIYTTPKNINKFYNPSTSGAQHLFLRLFKDNSYLKKHHSPKTAMALFKNFSLTKFRATSAVQVFLKTNSIQKMVIALGHENLDQRLINAYLPAPLWDYFTERWIRIYQNSIIYEAMKDSSYLFTAIDIKKEELDEFIKSHHFGELPEYLKEGKFKAEPEIVDCKKLGIFSISIPLLQWFIAIVDFINRTEYINKIDDIFYKWYECAILVLSQIELSMDQEKTKGLSLYLDSTIFKMYEIAKSNPLEKKLVRRVLSC
ncbi:hypothetical protein OHV69_12920 [Acinetobacter baumannii]|nr:hypothetical protein [Acinetobacter baumannii]